MFKLNSKLSELYKKLPKNPRDPYLKSYKRFLLKKIEQIKYEQTLRRKGLRTQGIFIIQKQVNHEKIKISKFLSSLLKN